MHKVIIMKKSINKIETHEKYVNFKMHQTTIDALNIGDTVVLTVNGIEQFTCTVLYGDNALVNIVLQDRGRATTEAERLQFQINILEAQLLEKQNK